MKPSAIISLGVNLRGLVAAKVARRSWGSCLLFWCVFKLSTPRHLKCQMPRQTKPGFFIFERASQQVRFGTKLTSQPVRWMSAFGGKPDIGIVERNDRLWLL